MATYIGTPPLTGLRSPLGAAELTRPPSLSCSVAPATGSLSAQRPTPDGGACVWISLGRLATQAEAEKGSQWPQPLVSHYARYFHDGNRTVYEGLVVRRQQRLTPHRRDGGGGWHR